MTITLGSAPPKILRVRANARVSFFIPKVYDNIARSVTLNQADFVDLTQNEIYELGNTLDELVRKQIIQIETIGSAMDASDVSYEPQNPSFFGGNTLPTDDALDILQAAIQSSVGGTPPYQLVTSDFTIPISLAGGTINAKPIVGSIDVTLPTAVLHAGVVFNIKNTGVSFGVNVLTTSGQLIDGQFTRTVPTGQSRTIQSDGANWMLI